MTEESASQQLLREEIERRRTQLIEIADELFPRGKQNVPPVGGEVDPGLRAMLRNLRSDAYFRNPTKTHLDMLRRLSAELHRRKSYRDNARQQP